MDLAYSLSGRVVGSLISIPIIFLTIGTKGYLIFFGVLLLITVFLSAKKWNVAASKKNITIAGACSGLMGTLIGIGGPPMAIVYQNSTAKNVVATLNMFFGIHVSKIASLESDYMNITPEPFFNLTVPMADECTLEKCIDLYTATEKLEGDNMILNDKTNKKEVAEKNIKFWR